MEVVQTVPARLANFPVSFPSVVMGLAGLTIATQRVESLFGIASVASTALLWLSVAVFAVITATYLRKLVVHREACIREFNDPVRISFFPAFSIAFLLLAIAFLQVHEPTSLALWVVGTVLHLVMTLVVLTIWVQQQRFQIQHMSPVWFLPVVGNILVPIAGVPHGQMDVSWFFFSVGLVFWTILQVIFFYRIFFHHPLPQKLLPTFFILLAPPAVGFIAYVRLNGALDNVALVLYHFALFLFLFLLAQVGMLRRVRFFLSWWAYSFPVAALAIASLLMYHESGGEFFRVVALVVYALLVALIATLAVLTVRSIARREICVED